MNRSAWTARGCDEARARILDVAEEHFRRVGYQKTSVDDIASELGVSRANVYRFFHSRNAINEAVCGRIMDAFAEPAIAIAHTTAPAAEKLAQLLMAIHRQYKTMMVAEKRLHGLVASAAQENWAVVRSHSRRMAEIFEAIIREGIAEGDFRIEDPEKAARSLNIAFMPFIHPALIERCVHQGDNTEANLREQISFILRALGRSDNGYCAFEARASMGNSIASSINENSIEQPET